MNKEKNEIERKALNKRLLKNTFISEVKNREKPRIIEYLFDFVGIIIAQYLADSIVDTLSIHSWFIDLFIKTVLIFVVLFVISSVVRKKS